MHVIPCCSNFSIPNLTSFYLEFFLVGRNKDILSPLHISRMGISKKMEISQNSGLIGTGKGLEIGSSFYLLKIRISLISASLF